MRKLKIVIVSLLSVALILGVVFFLVGYFKKEDAGLMIETIPDATVYIDGEQVGLTPYEATLATGEVVVKLIPDSFDKPLAPFETKINLASGIETVVQRNFAESENLSSGAIISFAKIGSKDVEISVVSDPDAAQVAIDGQIKGFAPYKSSSVTAGDHMLSVSAQGYKEQTITVRTSEGHKLTAIFKLAPLEGQPDNQNQEEEEDGEEEIKEKVDMVTILDTPTGFLRVRKEPSTLADEVGQVEPEETYILISTDEKTGWFKIEYEEGEEGWVSNTYAVIVEEGSEDNEESLPSPSPKSTPAT